MSARVIMRLGLMACAVLILAGVPAHAEWTCYGTLVTASSESTSSGSICANSYTATQSSNDVHECLREDSGDDLYHTWNFGGIPAGNLYLIYEGNRDSNGDGEYFKFSGTYDQGGGPIGVITTATISSTFELQGGIKYDLGVTTNNTSSFALVIKDSNPNGSGQSNVHLDYLAICSESMD